eukprot:g5018.t1
MDNASERMAADLPLLQNKIKRDPDAYREEFRMQYSHFQAELEIFRLQPGERAPHFQRLVHFLSQVMVCYPEEMSAFPEQLIALVSQHGEALNPKMRQTIVAALVLVRNRGLLDVIPLFTVFFQLFTCEDKQLRKDLFAYAIVDIKNQYEKSSNDKQMKRSKFFVFKKVEDDHPAVSRKALAVLTELYRRRIWTDSRTINVIASAVFSSDAKVSRAAMQFFLGIEARMASDEKTEEVEEYSTLVSEKDIKLHAKNAKKTRKRKRVMEAALKRTKKLRSRMQNGKQKAIVALFPALDAISDPQGFVERLLRKLRQTNQNFDAKLVMLNLLSRMVGRHKLLLLNLYSYLQRYTNSPTQASVTNVLAYLVQACHALVPAEEIVPVLRSIADNFVSDRRPGDVISIGINTIRAVFARVPHVLEEPQMKSLVRDLAEYKKFRDKGVVIAARGLINDIRFLYPELLKTKDRGREHKKGAKPAAYGEMNVATHVSTGDDEDDWGSSSSDEGEISVDEDEEYENTIGGVSKDLSCVSPAMLAGYTFKQRQMREERLATIREGRDKYGAKEKNGGSTNIEKTRKKNFGMVKFSNQVRQKMKVSLKDQQKLVNKRLKSLKADAKKKHRAPRRR